MEFPILVFCSLHLLSLIITEVGLDAFESFMIHQLYIPYCDLFSRLKSSSSLSTPLFPRCSGSLIIFVAICWTHFSISMSLALGSPELDTGLQVCLSRSPPSHATRFPCCQHTLLAQGQFNVHQVALHDFTPLFLSMHGVTATQVHFFLL